MYMGQSPLAEVGKAAKTGLMLYGLQKSGAIDALNKMGINPNKQGGFSVDMPKSAPAGAVAPIAAGTQGTSVAMGGGFGPAVPPEASAMVPVAPSAVFPEVAPQPQIDLTPPPDIGDKILNDDWHMPVSDVSNKTDFNPVAQQTGYNQMLNTGNEYQQAPGYGKIAKTLQTMFGMG
jgi:hypothetical protein